MNEVNSKTVFLNHLLYGGQSITKDKFVFCKKCQRAYNLYSHNYNTIHSCLASTSFKRAISFYHVLIESLDGDYSKKNLNRKQTLDLNKHCGVIIGPSGVPCMRSLTCKSHSMASKRAIKSRPKDFDVLLAEYLQSHPPKSMPKALPAAVNIDLLSKPDLDQTELMNFDDMKPICSFPPRSHSTLHISLAKRQSILNYQSVLSLLDRNRPKNKITRPL